MSLIESEMTNVVKYWELQESYLDASFVTASSGLKVVLHDRLTHIRNFISNLKHLFELEPSEEVDELINALDSTENSSSEQESEEEEEDHYQEDHVFYV